MIVFQKLRYKNFLSTGNVFTEIDLNRDQNTLVIGTNGSGKCLRKNTNVDIDFVNDSVKLDFIKFMEKRKNM